MVAPHKPKKVSVKNMYATKLLVALTGLGFTTKEVAKRYHAAPPEKDKSAQMVPQFVDEAVKPAEEWMEEYTPLSPEELKAMPTIDISGEGIKYIPAPEVEVPDIPTEKPTRTAEELAEFERLDLSHGELAESDILEYEASQAGKKKEETKPESFVERYAPKGSNKSSNLSIHQSIIDHIWKGQEARDTLYTDSKGNRRYTALNFSTSDLKLLGMLKKDKTSGALIWTEKSGVHKELGVSYEAYVEDWKKHAAAAREAFVEKASSHYAGLNHDYLQVLWNNVVQAYGGDNFLDAEGYVVNGKEYTLDAISITAMARFHGMKQTMKFLESRDRANPVISESMKETLERFHGSEHDCDMEIAPWRVFTGENGREYRTLDFRVQHKVQDMGKDDYMLLLESKAYFESRYKLDARTPSGSYMGYYQIRKSYLKQELAEYNKANGKKYTFDDFDKKEWLQAEIIKQFHQKNAGYMASAGLMNFLPYVMNRNEVEFEYVTPKYDVQESLVLSPEKFPNSKLLTEGKGKSVFGIKVGSVYKLGGSQVRVKDVRTKSMQPSMSELSGMAHLVGAVGAKKPLTSQVKWNQLEAVDGNKTSLFKYAFDAYHARNSRTIKDAERNEKWDVPRNKADYAPEVVYEKAMKEFSKQQAVQGRNTFDEKQYKRWLNQVEKLQSEPTASMDIEKPNWHHRVGQMSAKERRQHGIS